MPINVGTPVATSATGSTSPAATLADATVGALNVLVVSANSTGTGVQPQIQAPTGWTFAMPVAWKTGSPSHEIGVLFRFRQSGDPTTQAVSIGAAGGGNIVVAPLAFSAGMIDTTTPVVSGEAVAANSAGPTTNVTSAVTLAAARYVLTCFGNRSGATWSAAADANVHDAILLQGKQSSSASVAVCGSGVTTSSGAARSLLSSASTSVNDTAIVAFNPASGGSLTAAFTGSGSLSAPGAPAASTVAAFTGSGSLSASGVPSAAGTVSAALSGTGTLGATTTAAPAAVAAFTGAGSLQAVGRTAITQQLTSGQQWAAHRGGYASVLGECTLQAYRTAATQYSKALLEIPVWVSSDGVAYCSHDRTTGSRNVYTGPNGSVDITATSSTVLDQYTSVIGGNPLARLVTVLDALPGSFFVVDNKRDIGASALITTLDAHASGRWMGKQAYSAAGTWLTACQNAGAPIWAYFYPGDLPNLSSTLASLSAAKSLIVFGLGDYSTAPVPVQSDAATFFAFVAANGLLSWAHILGSSAQRSTADAQASNAGHPFDGYMVSAFATMAPADGVQAAFSGTGSLAAAAAPAAPAVATLSGSGSLAVTVAAPAGVLVAVLAGSGSLSAPGNPAGVMVAALAGAGVLAFTGGPAGSLAAGFTGGGALGEVGQAAGLAVVVTLAGVGTLGAAATAVLSLAAGLSGAGSLVALATTGGVVPAAFSGGGALTAAGLVAQALTVALAGSGVLASSGGTAGLVVVVSLSGGGTLLATTSPAGSITAAFAAEGALAATGTALHAAVAAFSGAGSLAATGAVAAVVVAALGGSGSLSAPGLAAAALVVVLAGSGSLSVPGSAPGGVVVVAFVGGGVLAALGGSAQVTDICNLSGTGLLLVVVGRVDRDRVLFDGSLLVWRLGSPLWRFRGGPDRWLFREAAPRWRWRSREGDVKATDKRLIPLQVQSPQNLRGTDITVTACVAPSAALPDSPVELPVVIPDSYVWGGPADWGTLYVMLGPGLPVGTAFVLAHVVAGDEDFWDVAASVQVEE